MMLVQCDVILFLNGTVVEYCAVLRVSVPTFALWCMQPSAVIQLRLIPAQQEYADFNGITTTTKTIKKR